MMASTDGAPLAGDPAAIRRSSPRRRCRCLLFISPVLALLFAFAFNAVTLPLPSPFSSRLSSSASAQRRPPCVLWMAPFASPGGYSSEAWSFIHALDAHLAAGDPPPFRLKVAHHADAVSDEFLLGLPAPSRALAARLSRGINDCSPPETVFVCHSEPGAWFPPLYETLPCPPAGRHGSPAFVIGRTMFETDRVTPEHAKRCNRMDAVWVPTTFHVATFTASGVDAGKVVKVVQPVDVAFFDPERHRHDPLPLPVTTPVLQRRRSQNATEFIFLSVFKWERRKGWDVLVKAFVEEFSAADNVALCLLTAAYHSDKNFGEKIRGFVAESGTPEPPAGWPSIYLIEEHIPQADLPRLYAATDAFVLPSRGEGWGRPIVEAMSMALPVIATNWSGMTEYLTEENGYPIPVERLGAVPDGPFRGHLWAEPARGELKALMRRVVARRSVAKEKGRKARADMVERFSPAAVGKIVAGRIGDVIRLLNLTARDSPL